MALVLEDWELVLFKLNTRNKIGNERLQDMISPFVYVRRLSYSAWAYKLFIFVFQVYQYLNLENKQREAPRFLYVKNLPVWSQRVTTVAPDT